MNARMLAMLLACLPVATAYAGGLKQGRITSVLIASSIPDKVFIKVEGNYSASQPEPACSIGVSGWDFALDLTTLTEERYMRWFSQPRRRRPL
ncbi:MAG: hypothetical protein WDO68_19870 [Gammaproteobacteria bacterium]